MPFSEHAKQIYNAFIHLHSMTKITNIMSQNESVKSPEKLSVELEHCSKSTDRDEKERADFSSVGFPSLAPC